MALTTLYYTSSTNSDHQRRVARRKTGRKEEGEKRHNAALGFRAVDFLIALLFLEMRTKKIHFELASYRNTSRLGGTNLSEG